MQQHDLIVIGSGPGGYTAAIRAAQLGLNVACIERESRLGGTCLRIGCIPSKALLESTHRLYEAQHSLAEHGIRAAGVEFDLSVMLRRKEQIVTTLTKGVEGLFKKNKVTRYLGQARFNGAGHVLIESSDGTAEIAAPHILIATGSKSASLPGIKLDGNLVGTSTEALSYDEVPKHLVVVGGGYIGMELGSVWKRLGAKVTVLEFLDRILPGTDSELAREAHELFKKQGIEFRLGSRVTAARAEGPSCVVECVGAEPIRCDRVLVAVGRLPNTDGLGLDAIGVATDAKGYIPVDKNFLTAAPGVFAIGDCIVGPMLAHKAEE
jgi:dihydrolipoamide dehydrogenase